MKVKLLALAVAAAAVLAGGGVAAADQAYSPDDQPTDPATDDRDHSQGDNANASDEYDEKIPAEELQPMDLDGFDITVVEPEPDYDKKIPAEDLRKIDLGENDIDIEVVDPEYDKKITAEHAEKTTLDDENVTLVGET